MRIAYIGSCLSGQVADALLKQDENNKLIGSLTHLRSDRLVNHWVKKVGILPDRDSARMILADLENKGELHKNRNRIYAQVEESLSFFLGKLKETDCLLLDNNYDLSSKLWCVSLNGVRYTLSNLQIKRPLAGYEDLGLFPVNGARHVYQDLVDFVRKFNPKVMIFILQYPGSGFALVNIGEKRIKRAELLNKEYSEISNAFVVPNIDVPPEDLSEKGAHYFSFRTYNVYAKLIARVMQGDNLPTWLKPGTTLTRVHDWLDDVSPAVESVSLVPPKHRLLVLGSYLSERVAMELERTDFSVIGYLKHVRLDMFARYLADNQAFGGPKAILDEVLSKYAGDKDDRRYVRLKGRLSNQSWEYLKEFVEKIKVAQTMIIDNHYDLGSPVFRIRTNEGSKYLLSNISFQEVDARHKNLGLMDLTTATVVYRSLFDLLYHVNPHLRIVFLQHPVAAAALNDVALEKRLAHVRFAAKALDAQRACIFPFVRMGAEHISERNPNHFSSDVYATYALAITESLAGKALPFVVSEEVGYDQILRFANGGNMTGKNNPYENLPDRQYWKLAVGDLYPLNIAGIYDKKFQICNETRISTFGSCFAQHIGHRLKATGFNFLDMEPAPSSLSPTDRARHGYGLYSARYGNVYTSLQMLQLFQQAFGEISYDEVWERDGRYYDPFRPNIFPDGFSSPTEMLADRKEHLSKVRTLFETSDVIVLTMGLTECWCNRENSVAYPTAPGVTVGQFDPTKHVFRNLGYAEIHAHIQELLDRLRSVNPHCRMLLTVSPVPLTATFENRHVLVSTMHSKSVLRAVAGDICVTYDHVDYFPSYEIIMSPPFRSMFFKSNLRNIHDEGVDFVMSHFFAQHIPASLDCGNTEEEEGGDFCDEVFLELSKKMAG